MNGVLAVFVIIGWREVTVFGDYYRTSHRNLPLLRISCFTVLCTLHMCFVMLFN